MGFVRPEQCDWTRACGKQEGIPDYVCKDQIGGYSQSHTISTDVHIDLCGETVPVVVTRRVWFVNTTELASLPETPLLYDGSTYSWCAESRQSSFHTKVSEDCEIKRSTLYYLDHRHNVCLYKTNTERFAFGQSTYNTALFKHPYGTQNFGKIVLNKNNYSCTGTEVFYLIAGGEKRVLFESSYRPIAELTHMAGGASTDLFDPDYEPDEDTELILTMGAVSSSDYIPWQDDLRYHGWYYYRGPVHENPLIEMDGGFRDYYYPQWCRELQEDPIWKRAAAERFYLNANPDEGSYQRSFEVTRPLQHPYPNGNHVKDKELGDVYQWLIDLRDGRKETVSSHNFDDVIKSKLPKDMQAIAGNGLYYPFGVL